MMLRYSLAMAAALFATAAVADEKPVLTVYTYDSFNTDWGPGPAVEKAFEETCGCDLQFVTAGDGAAVLARLRLEGERTDADVVLGLDTNLTAAAAETGLFTQSGLEGVDYDLPVEWDDSMFVPYDWSYFAFVHDKSLTPPDDFRALADSDLKIVIQDPRSSTPGLGLLLWVKAAYGDEAPQIWEGLSDNILTVTKGWSESYGMFLDGEAEMVLSYTTSPAFHMIDEDDDSKVAASFSEGHYLQIEVAGIVATSTEQALAQEFLRFMVGDEFQSVIPTTNWMYPAVTPEGGLPEAFDQLTMPETALLVPAEEAGAVRDAALAEWLDALAR